MKPRKPKPARAYKLTLTVLTTAPLKHLRDPGAYSGSIYVSPEQHESPIVVTKAEAQPIEPWDEEKEGV